VSELARAKTQPRNHAFATAAYRGFAQLDVIAANKLTLKRRAWNVASSDTGTSEGFSALMKIG
jgi:hypothetical protein